MQYKSKIYVGSGANEITQKAYTLANLMFGYKISKNFDIQLNIDNVFNKKYWAGMYPASADGAGGVGASGVLGSANGLTLGESRTFMLSAEVKF